MLHRAVCQRYRDLFPLQRTVNIIMCCIQRVNLLFLSCLSELPVKIVKDIEAVKTTVNERIELECEVSEEGAQVKW